MWSGSNALNRRSFNKCSNGARPSPVGPPQHVVQHGLHESALLFCSHTCSNVVRGSGYVIVKQSSLKAPYIHMFMYRYVYVCVYVYVYIYMQMYIHVYMWSFRYSPLMPGAKRTVSIDSAQARGIEQATDTASERGAAPVLSTYFGFPSEAALRAPVFVRCHSKRGVAPYLDGASLSLSLHVCAILLMCICIHIYIFTYAYIYWLPSTPLL